MRENSEIYEFEKNVNSQEVHEVLGNQRPASSDISNILFSNTPQLDRINSTMKKMVNSSIQTESDVDQNSIKARRLKNQRAIKGLELEIDQALNRIRITNSTTNFLDLTMTPDSTLQRITVPIYPPALGVWKQLRSLQTRKIILEVRNRILQTSKTRRWCPRLGSYVLPTSKSSANRKGHRKYCGVQTRNGQSQSTDVRRSSMRRKW